MNSQRATLADRVHYGALVQRPFDAAAKALIDAALSRVCAEGVLDGERAARRTLVAARGWTLSDERATRVAECRDPQPITAWIRRAALATTIDAVFDER